MSEAGPTEPIETFDYQSVPERRTGGSVDCDGTRVSFGGRSADHGDVLASYAAVLRAVRQARPDGELALRASDLELLAVAVGADGHDVETRIRALLGCTPAEAKRVHRELVKRRLLQPVAMLAVGTAIVWGPAAAAQGDRPTLGAPDGTTTTVAVTPEMGTGPQMTFDAATPATLPVVAARPTSVVQSTTTAAAIDSSSPATATGDATGATSTTAPATASTATPTSSTTPETAAPSDAGAPDVGIPAGETPTLIVEG